jgi:hypothetical protein
MFSVGQTNHQENAIICLGTYCVSATLKYKTQSIIKTLLCMILNKILKLLNSCVHSLVFITMWSLHLMMFVLGVISHIKLLGFLTYSLYLITSLQCCVLLPIILPQHSSQSSSYTICILPYVVSCSDNSYLYFMVLCSR